MFNPTQVKCYVNLRLKKKSRKSGTLIKNLNKMVYFQSFALLKI